MQAVSSAILDQIQKLDPPPRDASTSNRTPDGRQILRGAPISSSRNDPLPSDSSFPTPLPNIPLPYELTLLDNLFVNPMVRHNKASDYTCGSKLRCQQKKALAEAQGRSQGHHPLSQDGVTGGAGGNGNGPVFSNPTQFNSFVSQAPQSLPPGAFHNGSSFNPSITQLPQTSAANGLGLGAYGMAAVGPTQQLDPNTLFTMQNPGGAATPTQNTTAVGGVANDEGAPFDVFSFLMDDEAGLGNGWDTLEVPSDFSLWT